MTSPKIKPRTIVAHTRLPGEKPGDPVVEPGGTLTTGTQCTDAEADAWLASGAAALVPDHAA